MAKEEQMFQPSGKLRQTNVVNGITAINDHIIVTDMDFKGRVLSSGVMLMSDDGKSEGIRPRWGKVYKVGPNQTDVKVGQWIFIEHGRWTREMKLEIDGVNITARRVDPNGIIGVQDAEPDIDETISTAVAGERKTREYQ